MKILTMHGFWNQIINFIGTFKYEHKGKCFESTNVLDVRILDFQGHAGYAYAHRGPTSFVR